MIVFKLFLVLVAGGQYNLLSIGEHFYATEVECNEVGRQVAESYPKGQIRWFCEPRSPKLPEKPSERF